MQIMIFLMLLVIDDDDSSQKKMNKLWKRLTRAKNSLDLLFTQFIHNWVDYMPEVVESKVRLRSEFMGKKKIKSECKTVIND